MLALEKLNFGAWRRFCCSHFSNSSWLEEAAFLDEIWVRKDHLLGRCCCQLSQEISNKFADQSKTNRRTKDKLWVKTTVHPTCSLVWELNIIVFSPRQINATKRFNPFQSELFPFYSTRLVLMALCIAVYFYQFTGSKHFSVECPEGKWACKLLFLPFPLFKWKLIRLNFSPFFHKIEVCWFCVVASGYTMIKCHKNKVRNLLI